MDNIPVDRSAYRKVYFSRKIDDFVDFRELRSRNWRVLRLVVTATRLHDFSVSFTFNSQEYTLFPGEEVVVAVHSTHCIITLIGILIRKGGDYYAELRFSCPRNLHIKLGELDWSDYAYDVSFPGKKVRLYREVGEALLFSAEDFRTRLLVEEIKPDFSCRITINGGKSKILRTEDSFEIKVGSTVSGIVYLGVLFRSQVPMAYFLNALPLSVRVQREEKLEGE